MKTMEPAINIFECMSLLLYLRRAVFSWNFCSKN